MRTKIPEPGDLVWIPAGSRIVTMGKNFSFTRSRPSVGIYIEPYVSFAYKNWLKILCQGEMCLINKDKVVKIDNDVNLKELKC